MKLPPASDPVWQRVVSGRDTPEFEFLATRIFLGRAQMELSRDASPPTVRRLAQELHNIFEKNISLPGVARDVDKLTGKEGLR